MVKTTDQIVRIVMTGGGVIINGSSKTTDQLARIAMAASKSGATVILKNVQNKTTDQLARIGMAGKGHVILELKD